MGGMDKDFLITQFQHLAEEVRFSKRQQMMATWYILLLYGVIVHTYESWAFLKYIRVLPIIFSLFLLLMGLLFIRSCKISQEINNKMIEEVRKEFKLCDKMIKNQYAISCCSIKVDSLYYLIHFFACIVTILIIIN